MVKESLRATLLAHNANREKTLRNLYLICNICGGAYEADECDSNKPREHVCLSGRDIYDNPSLLRFYQNGDIPPRGNIRRRTEGEKVLSNPGNIRELPNTNTKTTFAIITRSGITTHDPPYPDSSTVDDTDRTNNEGRPEGEETATF
nr:hypothetical protein [Tanacetum cinerariifolium]